MKMSTEDYWSILILVNSTVVISSRKECKQA
jgi:hypothetical protein